jgi:hypothetical protein
MMPSSSQKQHNFMAAVANNPAFAKKAGVSPSVGQDFVSADKGKKFSSGSRADSQVINRPKTNQGAGELFKKGGKTMATKMNPGFMAMMAKKKDGMKKGGMSMAAFEKSGKDVEKKGVKEGSKADMAMDKKQMMMKKGGGVKKMATGGSVDSGMSMSMTKVRTASPSKDGVASKGKTQGKQIVMAGNKGMKRGGKC